MRIRHGIPGATTLAVVLLVGPIAGFASGASGKGIVILVRHAERVVVADPQDDDDPPLTPAGVARAERLADALAQSEITKIFTSNLTRTRETAKPLATKLGLEAVPERDADQLIATLKTLGDERVLVVGHSDSIPAIIAAFGGPAVRIKDEEFDTIFVLVPGTGALTRIKY